MFIVIQFPLLDARAFVGENTATLNCPAWPAPQPDSDFVRSFGIVRRRRQGGLSGWVGEERICEARHALRFAKSGLKYTHPAAAELADSTNIRVAFRRFYCDGLAVAKLEVGLAVGSALNSITFGDLLSGDEPFDEPPAPTVAGVLEHIGHMPVSLPNPWGRPLSCELLQAGKPLARLYAASSSKTHLGPDQYQPWWVKAGAPLVWIESEQAGELDTLPGKNTLWQDQNGRMLLHGRLPGSPARLWGAPQQGFAPRDLRELRIYLCRLHAEKECLNLLLALLNSDRINVAPRSPLSDTLQLYLNTATARIARLGARPIVANESPIGALARQVDDSASPGEVSSILQLLQRIDVRKNILRKVEETLQPRVEIHIDTRGGAYVAGPLTVGGDFVAGDKTVTTPPPPVPGDTAPGLPPAADSSS